MIEQSKKGWIKLSRDIADHWIWTDEFSRGQAWIDLLLHASHSDNQKMIIKGEVIAWHRGQQIRSIKTLEKSWKWSRSKVNRFLELLEKDGMIERKGGHLTTIISICNYESFQGSRTPVDTPDALSLNTSDGHLTDISRATNKNVKKEKNDKNEKEISNLPAKAGSAASDIQEAFNCWVQVMGKNTSTKLNKKREAAVRARLKEGYTIEQIKQAIFGCSKTPHNMGINAQRKRWDDLELICRDGNNVERFMDNAHNPPAAQPQQQNKWDNTDALAGEFENMLNSGDINL